jgi:predicted RNA-binding Zn ribbon-like protein
MPTGPRLDIVEHPRFEQVLADALQKQGLHPAMAESVRKLVTGTADPRTFVCCDSGCTPCVKDYLRAAENVLKKLSDDAPKKRRLWPFGRR